MPILTMLNDLEVRKLAEKVLGSELGSQGFDHVEVRSGEDHDGDEAVFVTAVMRAGTDNIPSDILAKAYEAFDNELLGRGERRFPYLDVKWIDDEPPDDLTDERL